MEMNVTEEQLRSIEVHAVRYTDVRHKSTRAGRLNRLHHRFLRADALQHRVRSDSLRQFLDSRHSLFSALGHNIRRAELAGKLLPRLVPAHGNDSLGPHLPAESTASKPDRAVAHDDYGHTWLDVSCIRREPACAQHVRRRE